MRLIRPAQPGHPRRRALLPALTMVFVGAVASAMLAFVPAFQSVSEFSWFIGAGLGAIVYLVVADRRGPFNDVSGEPIAVASTH